MRSLCDAAKFNTKLRNRHFDDAKLPNRRFGPGDGSPRQTAIARATDCEQSRLRTQPFPFHLDADAGLFARDWGGDVDTNDDDFGE